MPFLALQFVLITQVHGATHSMVDKNLVVMLNFISCQKHH
jgi:hypothetical protein